MKQKYLTLVIVGLLAEGCATKMPHTRTGCETKELISSYTVI